MKNKISSLFKEYPYVSRLILGVLLFAVAIIMSGFLNRGQIKLYFPYAPTLLLVLATWVLYKVDNQTLKKIGLTISVKNLNLFVLGIIIGAAALAGSKLVRALYLGENIEISTTINYSSIFLSLYYTLPQVATEELLFRGYLFQKTIDKSGVIVANIVFSILFTLVHVLDENALNNPGVFILLAVSIPVGHLFFATAFIKSKTLFLPIGLHLGNNWAVNHLVSNAPSENSFFYISNFTTFETWPPFLTTIALTNLFFLMVTFLIWKWDSLFAFIQKQ